MLQHLSIHDLVVVAHADIPFHKGMTVITGETGAGKSIILDALALALGERSDSHLVRPGCDKADITATFDISGLDAAIVWLNQLDLTSTPPNLCLIRRVIYANGRSRAWINGVPVTLLQVKLLGEHLLQLHGQHQHQSLLKAGEQLRLLDSFGQHDGLVSQIKTAYKNWEMLNVQRLDFIKQQTQTAQRDLLNYQLNELKELDLGENELNQLHEEHAQLANAQTYLEQMNFIAEILENEQSGVLKNVNVALSHLNQTHSKIKLPNVIECLRQAQLNLKEAIDDLADKMHAFEPNPERLNQIEQRLTKIHDMARKHRVNPEELSQHYQQLSEQYAQFSLMDEQIETLTQAILLSQQHYQDISQRLTKARTKASLELAKLITQMLSHLNMPQAVFTIDLEPYPLDEMHALGAESIIFGMSSNPGHPPQPLTKVASGGELSRISLAIEVILNRFLTCPCLVFDEVDVGISGATGSLIGKALSQLSQSVQVICITHLPQVAVFGDNHLHVRKETKANKTQTFIESLDTTKKVEEIARLLGGVDVSHNARANAQELIDQSKQLTFPS